MTDKPGPLGWPYSNANALANNIIWRLCKGVSPQSIYDALDAEGLEIVEKRRATPPAIGADEIQSSDGSTEGRAGPPDEGRRHVNPMSAGIKPGPSEAIGARTREALVEAGARVLCRYTWKREFNGKNLDAYVEMHWKDHAFGAALVLDVVAPADAILSLSSPTREETIEECARVAASYSPRDWSVEGMRLGIVAAIRALTRPDSGGAA